MYNSCVSSTLPLKCNECASFSFNGYAYCMKDRFNKYPLYNSSSCRCCCSNSMYRVPLGPSYVYGLRQSTLIQWSPCKQVILRSLDRCSTNFPVFGIERKFYYEKPCSFSESGRRGRFGCMSFEEKSEMHSVCDEAEALLSLLCEDVDEECIDSRERNGRKWVVEMEENDVENNYNIGKKKVGKFGVERKSKYEIESMTEIKENDVENNYIGMKKGCKSGSKYEIESTKDDKIRNDHWRENALIKRQRNAREVVGGNLVKRSHGTRVREEDKEALLSSESQKAKEEREYMLRKSNIERARKEEREDLSRREDHRQKVRKEGSSCSSYYSLSSTGELESDTEQEQIQGELSNKNQRYSRSEEFTRDEELGEQVGRHEDYSREYDWRKKSEKRLTDISIEENEFGKELSQKQLRISDVHESNYGKELSSYKANDERKQKSTSSMGSDQATRLQQRQTGEQITEQTETRMKHKQLLDVSVSRDSTETMTRMEEARDENYKKGDIIRREEESRKHSHKSQTQEVDVRGTFTKERESSIRTKSSEVSSSIGRSNQASEVTVQASSMGKSEKVARDEHTLSTYIWERQSNTRFSNQEEYKSHFHKSSLESRGQSSQTNVEGSRRMESLKGSERTTALVHAKDPLMASQNDGNVVNEKELNQRKSQPYLSSQLLSKAYSSSQLLSSSSTVESMSGFASQRSPASAQSGSSVPMEHSLDRPHQLQQETYGEVRSDDISEKPIEFVSSEDGLGSANRLQTYSEEYVGEFVEKVRHEVSSSEIEREKRSYETKSEYEGEQHNQQLLGHKEQGESQSKEQDNSASSFLGSRTGGPSDEMWVTQPSIQGTSPSIQGTSPSIQETSGTESKDDAQTVGGAVIKRPGQSLWHVIADIVRLRWISHSGRHTSTSGSGGRSSPHQSTSSETQISGYVPAEGNNGESVKKRKSSLSKSSSDQHQEEKAQIQSEGEVSNSRDRTKPEWEDAPSSISPSRSISLASNEETLQKTFEGTSTGTVITELSSPLPSMPERSPALEEITGAGQAAPSSSGTEQVAPSASAVISIPEVKDREVRQRRFQRANQVVKDRFDEWEEAYRVEAEQRRVDEMFMREALLEAKKAANNWEVPVGAVLVQGGKIIARGCNLVEELRDSTAHAEMICIREASNILRSWRLSETTLYVTLEPCPMCAGAILQARIDTVVWGAPNKLLGADGSWIRLFPDGDGDAQQSTTIDKPRAPVHPFHPKMTIRRGVLASECADAMQQFFQLRRKKEKKSDPPPASRLPISSHPNKFLSKMHDAFHLMFCL